MKEILENFDNIERKDFEEYDISTELSKFKKDNGLEITELQNEIFAFDFGEGNSEKLSDWGTFYHPKWQKSEGDGKLYEYPSIHQIDSNCLEYWKKRGAESKNPILKARYKGLVIDFEKQITGTNPSFENVKSYTIDLLEIVSGKYNKHRNRSFTNLKRTLQLAIKFNLLEITNQCKEAILNLEIEGDYRNDFKAEFTFDCLMFNKGITLSGKEELGIIQALEKKLFNVTEQKDKIDPWIAEQCAERLATYYRKHKKDEEVKRVIILVGKAYDDIMPEASGMQIANWLDGLHKLYIRFHLNEEADAILVKIRANGEKANKEMGAVPFEYEIPALEMKAYIQEMLSGDAKEIFVRMAYHFIPSKENAIHQIKEISKMAPTMFIIGQTLQDSKGRTIAKIGSLQSDLDGHIIRQISQTLLFSSVFLRAVVEEGITTTKIHADLIVKYLDSSPLISKDRLPILKSGIDAYFKEDYLTAIHILIPQIEDAIRNGIELLGGVIFRKQKNGAGYNYRTLDELIKDDLFVSLVGDDLSNYLTILLTDQKGWNLRNNVCHGIATPGAFNSTNADRLIHALLCLGLFSKN